MGPYGQPVRALLRDAKSFCTNTDTTITDERVGEQIKEGYFTKESSPQRLGMTPLAPGGKVSSENKVVSSRGR